VIRNVIQLICQSGSQKQEDIEKLAVELASLGQQCNENIFGTVYY